MRSRGGGSERARVLILLENAPVNYDRRVTAEARSLMAAGFTVSVICPAYEDEPLRENLDGLEVRRYRTREAAGGALSQVGEYLVALAETMWLMLGLARSPGFDVIQACNPPDLFFLITWPFKLAGKRFIFDQHDLSPELYSSLYGRDRDLVSRLLRWSERRSYRHADAVISCNESYRALALGRGGVSGDRVFVVRNGPREGWPPPAAPDPELKRGRALLVLYMGVIGLQDGVEVLMEAIRVLVHELDFTDVRFAFLGDGNAMDGVRERARETGIEGYLEFLGWVADESVLSSYLATADACVCPEPSSPLNDHSTFIKVMEYMSAGKPLVAFDLPETRFSAGAAAAYARPGDVAGYAACLYAVLTDRELREAMSREALRRIPELRWERQVPSLLAAYDRALAA